MFRLGTILLAFAALVVAASANGYNGFKIFEVVPETQEQTALLHELSTVEEFYDFFILRRMPNQPAHVMVDHREVQNFLETLAHHNMSYRVLNNNIGRSVEEEFIFKKLRSSVLNGKGPLSTDRFYRHAEINEYVEDLEKRYPERVAVETLGKSFEGREIKIIKISNGDGRLGKNVIFIDGGFHAREWMSPAAALYVIHQLVENFEENADLLLTYDIIILPVANPDGYEYTHLNPNTRFWRKTRRPITTNTKVCYGTDPNRNFGIHWNEGGASSSPCSEIYAGPEPFSEPETVIVRDFMHSLLKHNGIMYLTLHSYGNYLMYPWGWTSALPDTVEDLDEIVQVGASAIFSATGIEYTTGSSTNAIYLASGGSDDYAYATGFKIAITMELSGGGSGGFNPPPTDIEKMVREGWIGIRAMAKRVTEKYASSLIL